MTSAAAVVLHPHPGMGGDNTHPLVVAIADGLGARGVATTRPHITDPDPEGAAPTLQSIASTLLSDAGADRLVLVGYSWGSVVASLVTLPALAGRVLIAPPVGMTDVGGDDGTPTLVLVPAHDQFGGPEPAEAVFGNRARTTIDVIPGADHFLAGVIDRIAERTVDWAAELVATPSESS